MKKKFLIFCLILVLLLTTGCWDMVEINQRVFPYSIAIDLNQGGSEKYLVTISYVNINGIGKNATQKERVFVVTTEASSIFQATKQLSTTIPYPFYFKHLRVILIGEGLAKDPHEVRQIMDGLSRDFVINKQVRIVMAEHKAKSVLEAIPTATKQEEIEGTLFSLLSDGKKASRYTSKSLTEFIQSTDKGGVAVVPRMTVEKGQIKAFGGAIFKDYSFVGTIDEDENRAVAFMRDKVKSELVDVSYNGSIISYAITGQGLKQKLIQEDKNLIMKLDIEVEGSLQEYTIKDNTQNDDLKIVKGMGKAVSDELKKEIDKTLYILQKEYKSDAIGVGRYIANFHPKIWKEIEKDWDEVFSEMEIRVTVDAKIRRVGLVN